MKLMEKTNTVYLIRKSFIDETTELARCSNLDLAIDICKPGYKVYDEDGNILHSLVAENTTKYGKIWDTLKHNVEKHILHIDSKRFRFITRKELEIIYENLNEILQLMNKIEVEESRNELSKNVG